MTGHVLDALQRWLDAQDAPSRARLQETVLAQPDFERDTPWLTRAEDLAAQERHDELIRLVAEVMPGAFLCHDAHGLSSWAHRAIGKHEDADRERFFAESALRLIAASGDGTRSRPWQVFHVADEYAFLRRREVTPVAQRAENDGLRLYDVLTLASGAEVWFELLGGRGE